MIEAQRRPADRAAPAFALDSLTFSVPGRILLHPTTLDLPAGRMIGLLGPNGSGKSTLLKLLARQMRPTSGTIAHAGRPLASYAERDFARTVAYLPQDLPTAAGLRVRDLVALGRYPWHGALGRFGADDHAMVAHALERTALIGLAERAVATLSGGERQRVWMAMLVAQDARVLLLDEPISALDVAHQVEILALVRSLAVEKNLTVVVVLHDVNLAVRFCDEIVALKGGRVAARADAEAFLDAATLRSIYDVEMDVFAHPRTGRPLAAVV